MGDERAVGGFPDAVGVQVDHLETRDDVDASRIGIVGWSLGGYYSPRAAAFEKRFALCVAWGANHNWREVQDKYPGLTGRRAIYETLRRLITALADDLIATSQQRIAEANPQGIDDVRAAPPLIRFSDPMRQDATELKRFLRENLYRHYKVNRMRLKASRMVRELYDAFTADPQLLPPDYREPSGDATKQARRIADYIAGMTDRYALAEHRRLFDATPDLR